MTAHDPIADLEAAARVLAEGHDPAEVAVRLHGIAERLRQVRTAEDERRDICRLIVKRMDALSIEEAEVVRRNLPRVDAVLAMQSIGAQRFALDALERSIANDEHIGPTGACGPFSLLDNLPLTWPCVRSKHGQDGCAP
jgi:hypothetical protein